MLSLATCIFSKEVKKQERKSLQASDHTVRLAGWSSRSHFTLLHDITSVWWAQTRNPVSASGGESIFWWDVSKYSFGSFFSDESRIVSSSLKFIPSTWIYLYVEEWVYKFQDTVHSAGWQSSKNSLHSSLFLSLDFANSGWYVERLFLVLPWRTHRRSFCALLSFYLILNSTSDLTRPLSTSLNNKIREEEQNPTRPSVDIMTPKFILIIGIYVR